MNTLQPLPPPIDQLLSAYDWYDHPEGPKFVETHRDEYRTCGHWLFLKGKISAFHQVFNNAELWLIHQGSLMIYLISPTGDLTTVRLGTNLALGETPVYAVPAGYWQAATLAEGADYAFGSNVCAPAFSFAQFCLADREALRQQFPQHRDLITTLTYAT